MKLIAPRGEPEAGIRGKIAAKKGAELLQELLPGGLRHFPDHRSPGHIGQVDPVEHHRIRTLTEDGAGLIGSDPAHRTKNISFPGTGCLQGMLGQNPLAFRLKIGLGMAVAIDVHTGSGQGTAKNRCMGGEDGAYFRCIFPQI